MKIFSDLFASFDSQDSLVFLLFILVAFLIGFLLSWFVASRKTAAASAEAQKAQAEFKALDAEYHSFKEQYALKEADLQHAQVEAEDHRRQTLRLMEEKKRLLADLEEMQSELKRLESAVTSQQVTIEDLNDQILGLRTKNQQLAKPELPAPSDALEDALRRLAAVEEKLARIGAEAPPVSREVHASLEQLFEVEDDEEMEDEEARVAQARSFIQAALGSVLPAAPEEQKDDLQMIQGIGPFIEKQLNELGIFTYEQVSKLDEVLVDQLTTAIQFFPGRILKDDWVGQAAHLMANPPASETPSGEEAEPLPEHDPLQEIEGIGPKIEEILVRAGIRTFHHLSDAGVPRLQEILGEAGERFRLHDPSSWPEQARLAAAGKWEDLKRFKEFLNGGEYN